MQIDPTSFMAALAIERGRVVLPSGDFAIPLPVRGPRGVFSSFDGTCAVVSAEDKHLGDYTWGVDRRGYVRRRVDGTSIQMHREVLGIGAGVSQDSGATLVADHINRDKLDNRRENLRAVTQAQNCQNTPGVVSASSRFRGVTLDTVYGGPRPWVAQSKRNGKKVHIGRFATEQEAADAAAAWRRENLPFTNEEGAAA